MNFVKTLCVILVAVTLGLAGCRSSTPEGSDWDARVLKLRGYDFKKEDFFAATNDHDLVALRSFVNRGMDVNSQNDFGRTALSMAVLNGDLEVTDFLLKAGANLNIPDKGGLTPLFEAIDTRHDDIIRRLLEETNLNPNARGKNGVTGLISLSWSDDEESVDKLLDHGADVNLADNDGDTALHGVARSGNSEMMKKLLDRGANPNLKNKVGGTPLMWAAVYGNEATVTMLLERGADPKLKDADGVTALDWAMRNHRDSIVKLLRAV